MRSDLVVTVVLLGVGSTARAAEATAPGREAGTKSSVPLVTASYVNARHHGAKGDGKSDDAESLAGRLLDAAQTKGPICYVPAGLYRLDGPVTVPAGVTLCRRFGRRAA